MKTATMIHVSYCLMGALTTSLASAAQTATLLPGTALRIQADHPARVRNGAHVQGHLTQPVFLIDHQVVPKGALVTGTIHGTHASASGVRTRRLLDGDFTPPREPNVVFDTLILPAAAGSGPTTLHIDAPAAETDAGVLTLGGTAKKKSIKGQMTSAFTDARKSASDTVQGHRYRELAEKWAFHQLPYHPEMIWSGTHYNADLADSVAVPEAEPHTPIQPLELQGKLPGGTLHARLDSTISSLTAVKGTPVDATITQPLLSPSGDRLLVPEGTHLQGVVVSTQRARWFARGGKVRFAFRSLDLPQAGQPAEPTAIHGLLSAAETSVSAHTSIDEEGGVKTDAGPGKYAQPLMLTALAIASTPDGDGGGGDGFSFGTSTVSANGFGLIGRVLSLSTGNQSITQAFSYYSLSKSVYFHLIAKGKETTFAHDTEIEVSLSER